MTTDFNLRYREGMNSLLKNGNKTIAVIHDPEFEQLLLEAARLREQLDVAVYILDNLPAVDIDTGAMHAVLKASDWTGGKTGV